MVSSLRLGQSVRSLVSASLLSLTLLAQGTAQAAASAAPGADPARLASTEAATACGFPADVATQAHDWLESGFGAGVVMATIDAKGTPCYFTLGVREAGGNQVVDAQTIFEIGSISKVFTALALARLVESGKLRLNDEVQDLIPQVRIPKGSNRAITLQDLATQTSGLPRVPDNLNPLDPNNPYADYSQAQLWAFLAGYTLPRPVGAQYEYSNVGFGLLGQALNEKTGKSYEAMIQELVTGPLGMSDTRIELARNQLLRFATGHTGKTPVPHWDIPTLAATGALRSTAADMVRFVGAAMGAVPSPLANSFALTQKVYADAAPGLKMGLAWHLLGSQGKQIVFHNGGTGGFRSFAGHDPAGKRGVVVLANSSSFPVDEFAMHLLDPKLPLPVARKAIPLGRAEMDQVAGHYLIEQIGLKVIVAREGDKLLAGFVGQGTVELHALSQSKFYITEVPVEIEFELDAQGRATGLKLTQNGETLTGKRQQP